MGEVSAFNTSTEYAQVIPRKTDLQEDFGALDRCGDQRGGHG